MIRTGSSPTGVSSYLNSFHSQSSAASPFYTNVVGSTPPPQDLGYFASQYTEAPLVRPGSTVFVDPYGFTSLPATIGTLYFSMTYKGSGNGEFRWANSYTGVAETLLPAGPQQRYVVMDDGQIIYTRLKSSSRAYRIFLYISTGTGQPSISIVGPENITKLKQVSGGFQLSGLEGVSATVASFQNAANGLFVKKYDAVVITASNAVFGSDKVWEERGLVNSTALITDDINLYFFR